MKLTGISETVKPGRNGKEGVVLIFVQQSDIFSRIIAPNLFYN